jgi:hypothetical protein
MKELPFLAMRTSPPASPELTMADRSILCVFVAT